MYSDAEKVVMPLMFFILLAITVLLWLLLRNKSEKWQSIPFKIITLALIVGEGIKQYLSIKEGYNFWNLPLHFCSTYFIWLSLAEFSVGKMQKTMRNIAFVATIYLFVGLYTYPSGIFGDLCENVFETYFTVHSFFYHHLVILYMLLSIAFKRFHPRKRDAFTWMACFSVYFVVALVCAYTFEENFFNILNSEPLPILEPVRLAVGQVLYNAGLGAVLIFAGSGVIFLSAVISEKMRKKKETDPQ